MVIRTRTTNKYEHQFTRVEEIIYQLDSDQRSPKEQWEHECLQNQAINVLMQVVLDMAKDQVVTYTWDDEDPDA